jgi:death-on-curing protein
VGDGSISEPTWLTREVVITIQASQIREHGGQPGLRDEELLESALARARQRWSYEPDSDLASLSACYGFGLTRNHPFLDGNKRIGFVALNVFLILNGHEIEVPEPEVVLVMLGVADGSVTEAELAAWVRKSMIPFGSLTPAPAPTPPYSDRSRP